MSAKHTPGPWTLNKTGGIPIVGFDVGDGGELLPIVPEVHGYNKREAKSNARLIAAAPDMLAALRRAVLALAFAAETSPAMRDDYEAVSAAIAKATGAAQ
jgi:hypothetical protein